MDNSKLIEHIGNGSIGTFKSNFFFPKHVAINPVCQTCVWAESLKMRSIGVDLKLLAHISKGRYL